LALAWAYDGTVSRLNEVRGVMRRNREDRRRLLTRGERIVGWSFAFLPPLLVFVGVVVLANGAGKGLGIALLVVGLLLMLVPVSPILRARVRRREERARKE
jgi:hypothetical protein